MSGTIKFDGRRLVARRVIPPGTPEAVMAQAQDFGSDLRTVLAEAMPSATVGQTSLFGFQHGLCVEADLAASQISAIAGTTAKLEAVGLIEKAFKKAGWRVS